MIVLGISAFFHDAAAALLVDGTVVAAAEEERFSRIKHDPELPVRAAAFCLEQAGIHIDQVDHVVFYEKPLRKFDRILMTELREFPRGLPSFCRSFGKWLGRRLWQKAELASRLGCSADRILFSEHHLSHAAAAFFSSPFERAAILTVDGVGEWATTSIFRGESGPTGSKLELVQELHFPHSLGLLYSALTAYLGFEVNDGEYKVMGLSAYGEPRYAAEFEKLCSMDENAAIRVDMSYFAYQRHPTRSFTPKLEALLGPAREPSSSLELPAKTEDDRRFADIAATLQVLTNRYMLALARVAARVTGEDRLCLAGGVALNSVANRHLQDNSPFTEMFVQPAAGDAGGSLGAAQWVSHVLHGLPRQAPMRHAFLGKGYGQGEVEHLLEKIGVKFSVVPDRKELASVVARRLAGRQVGGWFQGRFEWGPRALGARSIVADARDPDARDRVNAKIKFREGFRPFAPAVLAEEADRWFEPPRRGPDHLAAFMCSVAPVTTEGRARLPAITHIDGSARLQRVREEDNPGFHELLSAFRDLTGVGVLLNTSMNLRDEPLATTPAEAYGVFVRSDLDFLVLERCLIEKRPS